jgi:hypothetical protein
MAVKYTGITGPMPSKIYPNWDLWFENMPSINPEFHIAVFLKPRYIRKELF